MVAAALWWVAAPRVDAGFVRWSGDRADRWCCVRPVRAGAGGGTGRAVGCGRRGLHREMIEWLRFVVSRVTMREGC